ncbi:hypothetical protein ASE49_09525 [Novosphingobium sp. Leaf2]|nr:hypothetical protein ASE49_09525 [Novosphingobium sp. Leaf2]
MRQPEERGRCGQRGPGPEQGLQLALHYATKQRFFHHPAGQGDAQPHPQLTLTAHADDSEPAQQRDNAGDQTEQQHARQDTRA